METPAAVALRKESVDRNFGMERKMQAAVVALRKESVDRNITTQGDVRDGPRRSPQGERG